MIDIHCHILPAIDDGATDLEEAVRMCTLASNLGCEAMVATPHQRHPAWWNTQPLRLQALLNRLRERLGDRPRLYLGAEIRVDPGFLRDLETFEESGLFALAGSRYLLLEFERRHLSVDPVGIVEKVRAAGWRPIIAHPELIAAFAQDQGLAKAVAEAGALHQITAMSVTGEFGLEPKKISWSLLEADLVHLVASDCHGHRRRPPGLKRAFTRIKATMGSEFAARLVHDNPKAVVEDRPVDPSSVDVLTARQ